MINNYPKTCFILEDYFILKLKENCKFIKGKKHKYITNNHEKGLNLYLTIDILTSQTQLFPEEEGSLFADIY